MSSNSTMSGHDHSSMDMGAACSMNMLGNWQTINTCVLTSSWHIRTEAQFAGTCIGIFLMTFVIETVRRWSREFDRWVLEQAVQQRRQQRRLTAQLQSQITDRIAANGNEAHDVSTKRRMAKLDQIFFGLPTDQATCRQAALESMKFRPQLWQQMIRSLLYGIQFTGAYIIMLISMTYNGYIMIAIVLGGILGHFYSTWDTIGTSRVIDIDDLSHGYSPNGGAAPGMGGAPAPGTAPCCERNEKHDQASISSSSDEIAAVKRQIVTLPEHGHDKGACCV
ncbi:Ctr-domain-containing protein [Testicularia cyperi]|uniref:Copper transport protein n=1 Tax=Testicularia cyperi TaxID=1882483 RepID=A0A317XZ10_9BASI|nr:Ctr-domain-containing protein [Testicularia cyperi]